MIRGEDCYKHQAKEWDLESKRCKEWAEDLDADMETSDDYGEPTCYLQIKSQDWCQEWYETDSRDAGKRARALRKAGFRVYTGIPSEQVTSVGRIRMTLLTIMPGENRDLDLLPPVRTLQL